jgi:hypothetical protein
MYTYSSEQGWGWLPSTLDDMRTNMEIYQRLVTLGFSNYQELTYRGGIARLYARHFVPPKKMPLLGFDFCCVLVIGGLMMNVGMKSLQDVFAFLKEIDAQPLHPKESQTVTLANTDPLQRSVSDLIDHLDQSEMTLLNVAGLQEVIGRLASALEKISRQAVPIQRQKRRKVSLSTTTIGRQDASSSKQEMHLV